MFWETFMRIHFLLILAASVLMSPITRVHGEDPKAVVEKAIAAYGGEAKVARLATRHFKCKGTLLIGNGVPFTIETFMQLPDKLKNKIEIDFSGQKAAIVEALHGDKAW